jgi:hypothetical protein
LVADGWYDDSRFLITSVWFSTCVTFDSATVYLASGGIVILISGRLATL